MDNVIKNTDVKKLAKEYMMYKVGDFINNYYFPVFVPIGIAGNIFSFAVMAQKNNRHSSMSVYLAALTIPDTMVLSKALVAYLAVVHGAYIPPGPYWYCKLSNSSDFISIMCSTLFILSMTFDRFYSIIMPHKAVSFNTVKRAKITVAFIVVISLLYNLPHIFITSNENWECVPYGVARGKPLGDFYYWMSLIVHFVLPFILLLIMNSVIIHKLRTRSIASPETTQTHNSPDQRSKLKTKNTEIQVFVILLLVTFSFLILTTPAYLFFLFVMLLDFSKTPKLTAGYYLFYNMAHKIQVTNHGINFFLYVISGKKFRTDLKKLFLTSNKNKY